MPSTNTTFKNVEAPLAMVKSYGLPVNPEALNKTSPTLEFWACTGDPRGYSPDVTPGQASNVTLVPDSSVPLNMRCYVTRVDIDVIGAVNWSNTSPTAGAVPIVTIQDSAGVPVINVPWSGLKGNTTLLFPACDTEAPAIFGPNTVNSTCGTPIDTWTYSAGTITLNAAYLVAGLGVGGTARIIDGTGKGQAALIATVPSTSTMTISPAFTVAPDATSVLAIDWQAIKTATDTSHSTLYNNTNYTANSMDNGFNVIVVNGAGAGSVRPISANTTAGAMTYAYALNTNVNTTTSLVQLTTNPDTNGAVDCSVGDKWASTTINKGLQVSVNGQSGTSPVGSSLRIYVEGFFAY